MWGVVWYFATIAAAGVWLTGSPLGRPGMLTATELVSAAGAACPRVHA